MLSISYSYSSFPITFSFFFLILHYSPIDWYSLMKWSELVLEHFYSSSLEDVWKWSLIKTPQQLLAPCRFMMPSPNYTFGLNGVEMISKYSSCRILFNLISLYVSLVSNCFDWPLRCVLADDWILYLPYFIYFTLYFTPLTLIGYYLSAPVEREMKGKKKKKL